MVIFSKMAPNPQVKDFVTTVYVWFSNQRNKANKMNFLKYFYYLRFRPKIFFPKKSYSMFGEDVQVDKFFHNKSNGFYVDVGCYHPLEGNNTYLLHKRNWRGINIDANSLSIDLFNIARNEDINVNLAVDNQKSKKKLFFRKEINMLNTISEKFAKIHFLKGFKEKIVNTDTLNSIIEKTPFKGREIDFLNIDVEGNELNVLQSLSFNLYNPKLICVEIHNPDNMYDYDELAIKNNPISVFLDKTGYKKIWNKEFSFIFKKI